MRWRPAAAQRTDAINDNESISESCRCTGAVGGGAIACEWPTPGTRPRARLPRWAGGERRATCFHVCMRILTTRCSAVCVVSTALEGWAGGLDASGCVARCGPCAHGQACVQCWECTLRRCWMQDSTSDGGTKAAEHVSEYVAAGQCAINVGQACDVAMTDVAKSSCGRGNGLLRAH